MKLRVTQRGWRTVRSIALAICASGIIGCYESRQEFTLNPDGSGKAVLEIVFPDEIRMSEPNAAYYKQQARKMLGELLGRSKGVEIWKDVEYKLNDDGTATFKGVAYFRDVSEVSFGKFNRTLIRWEKGAEDTRVLTLNDPAFRTNEAPIPAVVEESGDELTQRLAKGRAQYQRYRSFLAGFFTLFESEIVVHVPGSLDTVTGLTNVAPDTVRLTFDEDTFLKAFDAVLGDDERFAAYLREQANAQNDGPVQSDSIIYEKLGPFRATIEDASRPRFDYLAEVREAKAVYPELLKQLATQEIQPLAAPAGAELKSVRIAEIRMVSESETQHPLHPLGAGTGCALRLVADLTGAATCVDKATLNKVAADDGQSLLRPQGGRQARNPHLTSDKTSKVSAARYSERCYPLSITAPSNPGASTSLERSAHRCTRLRRGRALVPVRSLLRVSDSQRPLSASWPSSRAIDVAGRGPASEASVSPRPTSPRDPPATTV